LTVRYSCCERVVADNIVIVGQTTSWQQRECPFTNTSACK